MYRIDGKKEQYEICMEQCKIYCEKIPYYKNEFLVEKIKNHIFEKSIKSKLKKARNFKIFKSPNSKF